MADRTKRPPGEALVDLRRRLSLLPLRDPSRVEIMTHASQASRPLQQPARGICHNGRRA